MGVSYWRETRIYRGKTITFWRVYCGCDSFGRSIRKTAKTEDEAKSIETRFKKAHPTLDRDWRKLSRHAQMEVINVLELCSKYGVSLSEVWNAWCDKKTAPKVTVEEAGKKLMESLVESNKRASYIRTMRIFIASLSNQIGVRPVGTVTIDILKELYTDVGIRSKKTWRSRACTFFGWSKRQGYCDRNPAELLDIPSIDKDLPRVLTPVELDVLLYNCPLSALGGLSLMLFAGLRPAEAKQIRREDIDLSFKTIRVGSHIAKTRSFRTVHLADVAVAWLAYYFNEGGKLPFRHSGKQMTARFAEASGLSPWPRDCLRHTAASMMLARDKNADSVALELGNSAGVLHRHYKSLVTDDDCLAFWAMTPESVGRAKLK